jgi:Protein of unknown function (DUF503)
MSSKPFVCLVELHLHFNDSGSLKAKRKELSSIKEQLRQRATLLCALVGDGGIAEHAAALARFAEARVPDGCSAELTLRSLEDVCG